MFFLNILWPLYIFISFFLFSHSLSSSSFLMISLLLSIGWFPSLFFPNFLSPVLCFFSVCVANERLTKRNNILFGCTYPFNALISHHSIVEHLLIVNWISSTPTQKRIHHNIVKTGYFFMYKHPKANLSAFLPLEWGVMEDVPKSNIGGVNLCKI